LRLFLLIIALLATCFAWMGAVRSKERFEREIARTGYESRLAAEERWRTMLIEDMKRLPSDPRAFPKAIGLAELKNIDARMDAIRQELELMQ
jgi:hypothetical protein